MSTPIRTFGGFGGPGGWDAGADILGGKALREQMSMTAVEIDDHAVATARAAGYRRIHADIRGLFPIDFPDATGAVLSAPCPTFSRGGKRSGLGNDYQAALDAITCFGEGCGCEWTDLPHQVDDPRTALVVECARWAIGLARLGSLEWLICEQVPAVEYIWEDLAAELYSFDWEWVDVFTIEAPWVGLPVRRTRTFLVARCYRPTTVQPPRGPWLQGPSMAEALGWPAGERINTRGQRKTSGGNEFSADGPSWCLTGKARSWKRVSDGIALTAAEAGYLQGFPVDYPWQGTRTSQFQQLADVVCPPVAAAVLGVALDIDWRGPLRRWAEARHGAATPREMALATENGWLW